MKATVFLFALAGLAFGVIDKSTAVASPADSGGADASPLTEIIVTARRREENAQEVPIAITSVSQQTLQQNNVKTLGDLQYLVPGLSASTALTRDAVSISIRGQGSNATSGLPGVIAYLNEVPIPTDKDGNLAGGPGLLFDLENVQVLKGPQGTLFGKNSVGGALLLQSARPTNDFGGHVQVGYGNYNEREVDGVVNIPIVDNTLLVRIAINGQVRDGFTHVLTEPGHPNGVEADNRDFWSTRGTVTFRPNEAIQNDAIVTYSNYTSFGSPLILTNVQPTALAPSFFPSIVGLLAQQQALGVRSAIPLDTRTESSGSNLALNDTFRAEIEDGLTFRNILGFDVSNTVYALDNDATALPILNNPSTPRDQTVRQFTEEAQILGNSFGKRLKWIAGLFYLDSPPTQNFVLTTSTTFGLPADNEYRQGERSKAVFLQGDYDLSALLTGLKITAGVRYTEDNRFASTRGGGLGSVCAPPNALCSTTITPEARDHAPTWTLGLEYQVQPGTLLYLASRRGYRAGGSDFVPIHQFSPEFVTDAELGVKSDWNIAGIPIRTNAAVYYQDYNDIQVQQSVSSPGAPPAVITENAAKADIKGGEIEVTAQLTSSLQVGASFDYIDFRYKEFGPGVDSALLEADRQNAPPRKFGVSARYRLPMATTLGEASIRANFNWQATYVGFIGAPSDVYNGGQIKSFGLLNMSADWNGIAGSNLDLSLFGSNITNKVYLIGTVDEYTLYGFGSQRYGEPRMYGARLRYNFGRH